MDIRIDAANIVIETERLILRVFAESDLRDFYAYASVPGVGEMAGWPHHETIETSERILRSFVDEKDVFAVYHKADRKVIGSVGLHKSWANEDEEYKSFKVKEVGYVLSKAYWGQGLIPEAVKAVIDYGFNTLGLDAFTCGHFSENSQSRRVIEKCGFQFVKQSEFYAKQLQRSFKDMKYILLKERQKVSLFASNYYLISVLDDDSQERLRSLSDQLTDLGFPYARYTPFHITLWDGEKPSEKLLSHFCDVCSQTPIIETALASVGLFGLAVAFLSPLPNQALLTLVEKICGQTNAALTRWVPHVTLRIGEPDYIKRAVTAIAELFTPFAVRIESLELYECGEGYANFIQRFELVKGNDENA